MADRTVEVRLRADIAQYVSQMLAASAATDKLGKSSSTSGKEVDKLSGRLRLARDAALTLGPALAPLGAAAVGGVVALSAQLGALAGAMGVTLLAVSGLGDGLKALDKYQLEPTAENLKKLQDQMEKLGPAGEDFVRFLDSIEPNLKTLQMAAREGLLPGAQEGIEELMQRLPELRKLIREMATTMGDLSADAGSALAGPGFDAFFKYLRTDGIKILDDTSRTLGNLAEAAANTFAAFGGVSTSFSGGLLKFSEGLKEASANLDSNQGFQEFVHYIQTEGPHALETLGSLSNAFLQIVEAAAPLGGPVLTVIGKFADILAAIADSDLGTPIFAGIAALTIYNRMLQVTVALSKAAALANPVSAALVVGTASVMALHEAWTKAGDSVEAFNSAIKSSQGDIATQTALIDGMRDAAAEAADDLDSDSFAEGFKNFFDPDVYIANMRQQAGLKTGAEEMADAADSAAAALENQKNGVNTLVAPLAHLRVGMEEAAEAAQEQEAAINGAIEAMHNMREEALRAANAELNYQASIDDATQAVKDNGKTHDKTTEKGRANLQALYNLAGAWNAQSETIKGNSRQLQAARDNFIKTAGAMGIARDDARKLSRELFDIPEKRVVAVTTPGMDEATGKAKTLKQILDSLHSKDINIALHYQMLGNKPKAPPPGGQVSADGGTVPKTGMGYADRHPYLLADGEEVVSNRHGQADRHRGLLKAINAGRKMADGGTTGGGSGSSGDWHVVGGVVNGLKALQKALEKAERALDKETQARDDLQSQFDSIKSQVGGAYSSLDPFAQSTQSVWGAASNPLAMFDTAVAGNTATTQAAETALAFAQSHGLDGPLYAALAASGNLPLLQAFAKLSNAEIESREQAFAAQSNAQSALGSMAANAQVGAQLATANTQLAEHTLELKGLRQDVKRMDKNNTDGQQNAAAYTGQVVNGAASNGHRRGRR